MSGISNISYAGNGIYEVTINGEVQTMNIADMDLALRIEQVEEYDKSIADQFAEIQESNKKRRALNVLLDKMRKSKADGKDDEGSSRSLSFELPGYEGEGSKNPEQWQTYFGITKTDVGGTRGDKKDDKLNTWNSQWDANISATKSAIDNVTSDTELMMLRFRQLVDKRGTAMQEAKSTLQAYKQMTDRITS